MVKFHLLVATSCLHDPSTFTPDDGYVRMMMVAPQFRNSSQVVWWATTSCSGPSSMLINVTALDGNIRNRLPALERLDPGSYLYTVKPIKVAHHNVYNAFRGHHREQKEDDWRGRVEIRVLNYNYFQLSLPCCAHWPGLSLSFPMMIPVASHTRLIH